MGLWGLTQFESDVEKATHEKNTSEQWDLILDICDKIGSNNKVSKDYLKVIIRRLGHSDPHVAVQAITLLDACINNCGKIFHLEIASREFETEFRKLVKTTQPEISLKLRVALKKWAENEFKTDPQLNLIPSLYKALKAEGHDFTDSTSAPPKAAVVLSKDPNVVSSQEEQDDIAKAIELSLKENAASVGSPKTTGNSAYSSLYPSMSGGSNVSPSNQNQREPRKVRALYDFEAAEENELTFLAGEFIHVVDDGDQNWWKGYNSRGEGLFPSNFVTADLSVEPESLLRNEDKNKKSVQFVDENIKLEIEDELEINEEKIDRLLHLQHEANPEDPSQDSEEMLQLEMQVNQMLPLIDAELERVDRKHAQLTQLSSDLVEAVNLYHTLMRDTDRSGSYSLGGYPGMPQMLGGFNSMQMPIHGMYHPGMQQIPLSMPLGPHMHNMQMMPGYPMGPLIHQHQIHSMPPHLQNGATQPPPNGLPSMQQQQQQQHQISMQHSQNMPQQMLSSVPPSVGSNIQSIPNTSQHQNMIPNTQSQSMPQPSSQQHLSHMNPQYPQVGNSAFVGGNQPQQMMGGGGGVPGIGATSQPSQLPPNSPYNHHITSGNPNHIQMSIPNTQQNHNLNQPMINNSQNMVMNQPITTSILPQSDSRNNIPIYQHQR